MAGLTRCRPAVVAITHHFAPERQRVEGMIRDTYASTYGGHIAVTHPMLMSLRDTEDRILAGVGFRPAGEAPLFLETYLDRPVEAMILGTVARSRIVEIGNLAAVEPGASYLLFMALAAYLHGCGFEKAVVTATRSLRRLFRRIGFDAMELCQARPERMGPAAADWGSYYAADPRVVCGDVAFGAVCLDRFLTGEGHRELPTRPTFPRLHPAIAAAEVTR
ncbi:thermostable hemolysin [Niveispirillum fermenti]|uniref:thermostable hemolysin n=1 Tax=Niveispirillum fermenti TaxID=1233113 RepID=UPI003A8A0F09